MSGRGWRPTMTAMDNTQTLAPATIPASRSGWAKPSSGDAYQQMFADEPRDWSLLRLVLAAGLTVMALGVIAAVYP
jgi:hypothetical protein